MLNNKYRLFKKKLSNGGNILAELPIDDKQSLIGAHFDVSDHHPYVQWTMNQWDRSTYWGNYFKDFKDMYAMLWKKYLEKAYLKKDIIETAKQKEIHLQNLKFNGAKAKWEMCECNDAQLFICKLLTNQLIETVSIHYTRIDCSSWSNWLSNKYQLPVINDICN